MEKRFLMIVWLLVLGHLGFAQNFDRAKLDKYFDELEKNDKFMGSVAVSKDGAVLYSKTVGFVDFENKIKANENSKYRIGSISKSFTAVLVLKAVEKNKLELNQTIDKWFPAIKNSKKITVKHLLSHRSGIHSFTEDEDYMTWNTEPKTREEMVKIIAGGGSDFNPNSKASYSNSNYLLLSYILEETFSKSYSEILQEFIVEPLGLKNTYLFGKINTENNECKSYNFLGRWCLEPETDYSIPLGAGAIISTPTDLTIFADGLFGGDLLNAESLEIMKTIKDGYGIGLFQFPFNESVGYGHTGGIDGFSSVFSYFADEKISYALTSNGSNYSNNEISIAVLSAIYGKPYEIPVFKNIELTAEELDDFLGLYISDEIALKIKITKKGNTLIAQGSGQPPFSLEAIEKNIFKFDPAGLKLVFNKEDKSMTLFQGGGEIKFHLHPTDNLTTD